MAARNSKSNAELEGRYEQTARLIGKGLKKCRIKQALMKEYGVSARTCETYISRARALIRKWSEQSKPDHLDDATAFYLDVIDSPLGSRDNPGPSVRDKLEAREALNRLYDLYPAQKVKHQGDRENPVVVENTEQEWADATVDELLELRALRQRIDARKAESLPAERNGHQPAAGPQIVP